jgi:hypothetical protein
MKAFLLLAMSSFFSNQSYANPNKCITEIKKAVHAVESINNSELSPEGIQFYDFRTLRHELIPNDMAVEVVEFDASVQGSFRTYEVRVSDYCTIFGINVTYIH